MRHRIFFSPNGYSPIHLWQTGIIIALRNRKILVRDFMCRVDFIPIFLFSPAQCFILCHTCSTIKWIDESEEWRNTKKEKRKGKIKKIEQKQRMMMIKKEDVEGKRWKNWKKQGQNLYVPPLIIREKHLAKWEKNVLRHQFGIQVITITIPVHTRLPKRQKRLFLL